MTSVEVFINFSYVTLVTSIIIIKDYTRHISILGVNMKKLLFGALLTLGVIGFVGCADKSASTDGAKAPSAKCGSGKCGKEKKDAKCGAEKDAKKCGAEKSSKCGSEK